MDLELRDRVVLITGSERGTGRGCARVVAREGATVLVHGFELAKAERVASELRDEGHSAFAISGDIRTDEGAKETAAAARGQCGHVDVLVNNYGVAEGHGWLAGSTDDWIDIYHKNVLSGVRLTQAFLPAMRDRGFGRVIFVSTVGATRPQKNLPHYYASKSALVNMTVSLAQEVAGTGITVNTVSPGIIATDEVKERFLTVGKKKGWGETWEEIEPHVATSGFMKASAGIVGTPEDVGYLIAFLASDRARYIHGANLRIDGGAADSVQ
jgi:NAD(P)-dependent dehydrogenase (short-subunit alcohol dehydrogenase family)